MHELDDALLFSIDERARNVDLLEKGRELMSPQDPERFVVPDLAAQLSERVQRGLNYAIVDEVDSILIDEARTPLIISGPLDDRSEFYNTIDAYIPGLDKTDFEVDEK